MAFVWFERLIWAQMNLREHRGFHCCRVDSAYAAAPSNRRYVYSVFQMYSFTDVCQNPSLQAQRCFIISAWNLIPLYDEGFEKAEQSSTLTTSQARSPLLCALLVAPKSTLLLPASPLRRSHSLRHPLPVSDSSPSHP